MQPPSSTTGSTDSGIGVGIAWVSCLQNRRYRASDAPSPAGSGHSLRHRIARPWRRCSDAKGRASDIRVHRGAALPAHVLDVSGRVSGTGELQRGKVLERRDRRDRQAARDHAPEHRDVLGAERAQIGGKGLGIAGCRGIDGRRSETRNAPLPRGPIDPRVSGTHGCRAYTIGAMGIEQTPYAANWRRGGRVTYAATRGSGQRAPLRRRCPGRVVSNHCRRAPSTVPLPCRYRGRARLRPIPMRPR
jgi:hypothetical protein